LYDEFEEHGINGYVQNKTTLKCAKSMEIGSAILKTEVEDVGLQM